MTSLRTFTTVVLLLIAGSLAGCANLPYPRPPLLPPGVLPQPVPPPDGYYHHHHRHHHPHHRHHYRRR